MSADDIMLLPFDRTRLGAKNALDRKEAWRRARRRSPAQRLHAELELSQLVKELRSVQPDARERRRLALAEKSRLWVAPLRAIAKTRTRR